MVRPLRVESPDALYHLTSQGNAQQDIYVDDQDRPRFLTLHKREILQQGWRCYAYWIGR